MWPRRGSELFPYPPPMDLVIVPLIAAALAAITLLSGFGLGTVLMPVFALFFPIEVAIAATGVVHLSNNLFKLGLVGRHADLGVVLRFGLPAIAAAFIGAGLLTLMAPSAPLFEYHLAGHAASITITKLIASVLLAFFAMLELLPWYQQLSFPRRLLPLGGALSGFFGGLTGMQGALRAPFLLRCGLSKEAFVGSTNVVSTAVDLTRLLMYVLGYTYLAKTHDYSVLASPRTLLLVSLTCIAGCIGSLLGKRFLGKVTMRGIRVIVAVLLFVLAGLLGAGII